MTDTKAKTKGGVANLKPCKPGETHNPNGRPKGQRNYSTLRRIAFERIGKVKNMSAEEVEELMIQSGLDKALKGDPKFYQDDLDRAYGKPKQDIGIGGQNGEPLTVNIKMV